MGKRTYFLVPLLLALSFLIGVAAQSGAPQIAALGISPSCPSQVGQTVTWTASASGGTSPLQFLFWLRNQTAATWTILGDYTTVPTAPWTPTEPGSYFVQVWVRSSGSSQAWEAWANSPTCVLGGSGLPELTSATASPAAPVPTGTAVTWAATATGGVAPLQYLFWLRNETAGTWALLRDYSAANTASWTPTSPGLHFVQAWARSAGSSADWETWVNSPVYSVTSPSSLAVQSVSAAPASTAPAGTEVTWTAVAAGGPSALEYRFWLRNETAGTWTIIREYAQARTASWIPSAPGMYFVQVWARSAGSSAEWEAWANSAPYVVTVPVPPTITSISASPGPRVAVGTPMTFAAVTTGGIAPLQFKFWLRNETTGNWTVLREFAAGNTQPWVPTSPGPYSLQVWVRSAGSSAEWEGWLNSGRIDVFEMGSPQWTTVVTNGTQHAVHWSSTPGALRYRVYRASSRQALQGDLQSATFVETTASPLLGSFTSTEPAYFRVFGMAGTTLGGGGPIAVSTAMTSTDVGLPYVTPSLWDIDGDGCLDAVGARGTCTGTFETYPLEDAGLEGLLASGRVNRDSRFADFNGDGHVDIFTNVYARATATASRAILHIGDGTGRFTEDPGIRAMQIGGFGETVLAADFDNDGDVDIFLPTYTHVNDGGHNWLLINDGAGHFTDIAQAAGVSTNTPYAPEGAQAIDINQDGWIDIHVASRVFINNGNLTFTDRGPQMGLPVRFDEGMRFVDVDLDGDFDLIHHDSFLTKLYRNVQGRLDSGVDINGNANRSTFGYGLNVCDVNGDGFEDVLVANNDSVTRVGGPRLLLNVGGVLTPSDFVSAGAYYIDLMACVDLDRSGLPDVLARWAGYRTLINRAGSESTIRLRIVGSSGAKNQQGRLVRIRPSMWPDRTMLRVVESGSSYMAQNGYDLLVAAPWSGEYEVSVRFAWGWAQARVRSGDELTIYADGSVANGF